MALLEWKKSYETGIASVDHEHRTLIELLNRLHERLDADPSPEEVDEFLAEVHTRIAAHFALEERIMREAGYDDYPGHKADHERLLDEIRDIMEAYEAGEYRNFDEVLADHLRDWFGIHFATRDARLHRLLG